MNAEHSLAIITDIAEALDIDFTLMQGNEAEQTPSRNEGGVP